MNTTRPPLDEAAHELKALLDQHVTPFYSKLSDAGLLVSNPAGHLVSAALRELGEVYAGPKLIHFGRLEDGARFVLGDSTYVKVGQGSAARCLTGELCDFAGSTDVMYDAALDVAEEVAS